MPKSRSYVASLLRLAWPVALARLGIMGMGVVDVIMVGQLAPNELAHQALGWAPTGVILVTSIGLLTGVQVLGARAIGAGEPHAAGGAWRRGLILSGAAGGLAIALLWLGGARLFTTFGIAPELANEASDVMVILALSVPLQLFYVASALFLESIQRPLASTVLMWLANGVNFGLNLLWVPAFGAEGSAWATVGARVFLAGGVILFILTMKDAARYGVRARAVAPGYGALLRVGAAAAVSQAAEAGAFSAMTIIAGRIGGAAVAAYQILLNQLAIVFMVALGLSAATAVLTAEAVGRAALQDAARASWTGLALCLAAMAALAGLFWAASDLIAHAFTAEAATAALTASLIWLAAAAFAPDGGQAVAAHALRARGDNWFPTASHVLAYVVIMPALAYTLAEGFAMGVKGLMLAIFWASVVSISILTIRLWALTRPARA
ncbi:MAG: polysaccharide biosynthesis C-terminal domain-containing protein [Hydrogenophilaceae bacterium]|jgi:MATE family multidrug resistance protein|nr:polysaccharide biosynthesis C-terminal domain-containing protein [Hydrogenophilaceae bacterium]